MLGGGTGPAAIMLGGANGAGKTTFARALFSITHPEPAFLSADEVAREGYAPLAAGRETLRRLAAAIGRGGSFVLETTLSRGSYARQVPSWRRQGYHVVLHVLDVMDADFAVRRVARRVAVGGHHVPEADVRRRYARGATLLESDYKPVVDEGTHWHVKETGLGLYARSGP